MRLSLYSKEVPAAARFTAAARSLGLDADAAVLAYHPIARMNPFQDLLYSRASHHNVAAIGAEKLEDLLDLSPARALGVGAIAHLHWTSQITDTAESDREAQVAVDEFHEVLDELKAQGIRLMWTIHNRLPHRCAWPAAEIRLRNGLASRADAIHLMNSQTIELLADIIQVPHETAFLAPHPSYLGAYPQHFERTRSRLELGLASRHFVAGLVGSIQPYKGVEEVIEVAPLLKRKIQGFDALVAGIPGKDPDSQVLVERLNGSGAVLSLPSKLDDKSLARIVTSLDIMILPYRASLNSGAAMLALTFGVPVLGPAVGPFLPLMEAGFALGYDPGDSDGLLHALEAAPDFVNKVDREAMASYVDELKGTNVSDEFFKGLWSKVGAA